MMHPGAYLRFARYVLRHKWFVFVAGLFTRTALWRLVIHDWSKFTPIEFLSYTEYHNGDRTDSRVLANYEAGRRNHLAKNPHHPECWQARGENGEPAEIPPHLVREMVADWMGASRAITGKWSAEAWYASQAERMVLHPTTRAEAERLLAEASHRLRRVLRVSPRAGAASRR